MKKTLKDMCDFMCQEANKSGKREYNGSMNDLCHNLEFFDTRSSGNKVYKKTPDLDSADYESNVIVKTLLNMTPDQRKSLFTETAYVDALISNLRPSHWQFFEPEEIKMMLSVTKVHKDSIKLEMVLANIEDFNNVKEEELKHLFDDNHRALDRFVEIFGDLVKKVIYKTKKPELDHRDISKELRHELLVNAPKPILEDMGWHRIFDNPEEMIALCEADARYLPAIKKYVDYADRGTANRVWANEAKVYSDFYRHAFIIAQCCINKEIPQYQAAKLKDYAVMCKMYAWDFNQVIVAMKDMLDSTGKIRAEVPKGDKPEEYVFCIQNLMGGITAYKVEKDRDEALIKMETAFPSETFKRLELTKSEFKKMI